METKEYEILSNIDFSNENDLLGNLKIK